MNKTFIWLLASILPLIGFSQEGKIAGTVKDSKGTIPFTDVILLGEDIGAVTDENGNFEIDHVPEGHYTLEVSYMGYDTYKKQISVSKNKTTELTVVLENNGQKLNEIVITGVTRQTSIRENPIAVS